MNLPTTMTITEKENLAQQYKVHEVRHKYAAAAGSFCFVTTENGEQQDIYNLTTLPGVQRSLCLDEVIDGSSSTQVELPKRS